MYRQISKMHKNSVLETIIRNLPSKKQLQYPEKENGSRLFSLIRSMVEMAVIETASEKPLQGLSTSVSYLLTFPLSHAGNRACDFSRHIIHDRLYAFTCSRSLLIDASYAAAVLRTETAAI